MHNQSSVQNLMDLSGVEGTSISLDLNGSEASLGQDGQIILTSEDGNGKTVFFKLCTVAGQELLGQ